MYVKWEHRKARISPARARKTYMDEAELTRAAYNVVLRGGLVVARLVKSERHGKQVKQVVLAYLGSIREGRLTTPEDQLHFWRTAQAAMRNTGLKNEEKFKIDKQLQARVPKPTQQQIEDLDYLAKRPEALAYLPKDVRLARNTHQLADIVRELERGQNVRVMTETKGDTKLGYNIQSPFGKQ